MRTWLRVHLVLLSFLLSVVPSFSQTRIHHSLLRDVLKHNSQATATHNLTPSSAVKKAVAPAKVFRYTTTDYPGAAGSLVFDANTSTQVGAYMFNSTGNDNAFTFGGGVYRTLAVPGAAGGSLQLGSIRQDKS